MRLANIGGVVIDWESVRSFEPRNAQSRTRINLGLIALSALHESRHQPSAASCMYTGGPWTMPRRIARARVPHHHQPWRGVPPDSSNLAAMLLGATAVKGVKGVGSKVLGGHVRHRLPPPGASVCTCGKLGRSRKIQLDGESEARTCGLVRQQLHLVSANVPGLSKPFFGPVLLHVQAISSHVLRVIY